MAKPTIRPDPESIVRMKEQILALATKCDGGIPYARLCEIDGFKGECTLAHPRFPCILFWKGLSDVAAGAIAQLIDDGRILHEPTDEIAYLAHGQTLDFPLFTPDLAPRANTLKSFHWMPVLVVARQQRPGA